MVVMFHEISKIFSKYSMRALKTEPKSDKGLEVLGENGMNLPLVMNILGLLFSKGEIMCGAADETRTRDPLRDRQVF